MVELTRPTPKDVICDPACGTAGFLVAAGEYLRDHHPEIFREAPVEGALPPRALPRLRLRQHHARIGSMNMLLHGVENPVITHRDSLAQDHAGEEEKYTLVSPIRPSRVARLRGLCQGPAPDRENEENRAAFPRPHPPPHQAGRTRRGDRARRGPLRLIEGPQAAPPDFVEEQKLDAVISLPGGVFKPYAASPPPFCFSRRPIPAVRTRFGSTT